MNPFHQPTVCNRPRVLQRIGCANILFFVASGWLLFSTPAVATPADEITRAVTANGVADVSQARPRQFVKALTSVALRVQPRDLPDYAIAALNLRPDLAALSIAVVAKAATTNWQTKPAALCIMIERIVTAAIAAKPDAAVVIARAGAAAAPTVRRCVISAAAAAAPEARKEIVEAAGEQTPPFAFLTFSTSDSTGFSFSIGTLSPANIFDRGDGDVNSPEQPPAR